MGTDKTAFPSKGKKGSGGNTRQNYSSNGWQGFVNVALPDGAKKAWFKWASEPTHFYSAFAQLLEDGYKVTIKHEPNNATFAAFATHGTQGHPDNGWGLSERAGDPYTALHRLVYIHSVILGGDWSPYKAPVGWVDDWGNG